MPDAIPYRLMFEDNPQPMWMYDLETLAFLAVNHAAVHLYGYTREEFLAMTIKDIRPPEDVPALLKAVAAVVSGYSPPDHWRHARKDGTIIQVEITSHTIDFSGRAAELVMVRDMTARRAAETRSARQREALIALTAQHGMAEEGQVQELRQILEVAAETLGVARVSVWRYRSDQAAIECLDLFDAAEGQHAGGAVLEAGTYPGYFAALTGERVIAADDAMTDPRTSEFAEGYLRPIGIGAMLDVPTTVGGVRDGVLCHEHVGGPRRWSEDEQTFAVAVGNLVSLTLERQVRRQAEDRFRELAETIEDVFWIMDARKGRMLYVSPAFERIWGRSSQELYDASLSWAESIHPEDRDRVMQAASTHQVMGTYDEEYRILRPDGGTRWVRDQAFRVLDDEGGVLRVVGVARDITEQHELEKQFRHAQRMEAVGQLAGGVAHDFNNILTAIQFNASLLQSTDHLPAEAAECARDIEHAVQRASGLTRRLLTFSRKQVMQKRHLDLNTIVTEMTTMLRRIIGEDVAVDVRCTPDALPIHADPGMIEQVLMNLAVNARDAMPAGGTVFIETTAVHVDGLLHARLSVRDTGTGMPPEVQAKVFEPFFTTKGAGRGTGLGLAMVYGIVEQHRGRIELDSVIGRGTTFTVDVPCASAAASDDDGPGAAAPAALPAAAGQLILVVEDEADVRHLTGTILTRAGYRVLVADHGAAALALWAQHKDSIALVLTDIVMPEGMTGVDLARAIRRDSATCPIVFTSGYAPEAATKQVELTEGVNFLPKPLTAARLLSVVGQVLAVSGAREP